jgi:flavodoxin
MSAIVVFDSLYGNTERLAEAIGDALESVGPVSVLSISDVPPDAVADLWVFGGPTQNHGMSRPLATFVDHVHRGTLRGVPVATFDTRYEQARLLTGSAAKSAASHLRRTGCRLIAPPESFFVERGPTPPEGGNPNPSSVHLAEGELKRARAWGVRLAAATANH